MLLSTLSSRVLAAFFGALMVDPAWSYVVLGNANPNPNQADRDTSYTCCAGDNLQFTVSGQAYFGPGAGSGDNPDGNYGNNMTTYGDGISAPLRIRINVLVDLFLSEATPTGSATPGPLDFAYLFDLASLASGLGQIFFIVDLSLAGDVTPLPTPGGLSLVLDALGLLI